MTTHLVTFSDESMSRSAELCVKSAELHGVNSSLRWHHEDFKQTDFYKHNEALLSNPRGLGFWAFKPWVILKALEGKMTHDQFCQNSFYPPKENDILIWADSGIEFINNTNYIIDRMDQDIFLFGNNWSHSHWCKRDIIEAVWPRTTFDDSPYEEWRSEAAVFNAWDRFDKQVQASVIFFRVNDNTRAFVKEWLDWCLKGARIGAALTFGFDNPEHRDGWTTWSEFRYLIDDSPSVFPNHPEFQENRHDQAILTTMAYRDGIKLHWWPAMYNRGGSPEFIYERGIFPDEGYPCLFSHHRRRNSEY